MVITRPESPPQEFEGIANCFVGQIDGAKLYPLSEILSQREYPPVELIFEATAERSGEAPFEVSSDSLRETVAVACDQYLNDVGPAGIEERFQDYLTEELGISVEEAIALFRNEGIAPFLLLQRIFVSEPLAAICLDFACFGEEYLDEYGFSVDQLRDRIEFVTPRDLMREGSYPASRHN